MRTGALVAAFALALVSTAVLTAWARNNGDAGAAQTQSAEHAHDAHAGHAHDGHDAPAGKAAPAFPLLREDGRVPAASEAKSLPVQLRSFRVVGDEGLAKMAEDGYLAGAGTLADPYVIDGFRVQNNLEIRDTTRPLIVRNSLVEGQLKLNYNGPVVYVHHNRINDLRVNENVERQAGTTGGLFEGNAIAVIGQLRHFTGEFASNMVGPRPAGTIDFIGDGGLTRAPDAQVWNFDGYHLAWVHDNVVKGRVDVKLHGHYHGSCLECVPHDHAASEMPGEVDHQDRFHFLRFEGNKIAAEGGDALRFYDEAHAGDDRTANSEPNVALELPHAHHLALEVVGNTVDGGALAFDIVNAKDERHASVHEAVVKLEGNRVTLARNAAPAAFALGDARAILLEASRNAYAFTEQASLLPQLGSSSGGVGFLFARAAGAGSIADTTGSGAEYGVRLARSAQLKLALDGNDFQGAAKEVQNG